MRFLTLEGEGMSVSTPQKTDLETKKTCIIADEESHGPWVYDENRSKTKNKSGLPSILGVKNPLSFRTNSDEKC